jgi:hypothetical protein
MTIKTTRWSPDTCTCVIEYRWDDTQPESSRTHTLDNYVSKCPAHTILADDTTRYNTVLEENPRKNNALRHILDNSPSTGLYDTVNGIRELKSNIRFDFTWSGTAPNRVLNITFTGITLTTNQKNTLQSALNTRLGSGKVLIA